MLEFSPNKGGWGKDYWFRIISNTPGSVQIAIEKNRLKKSGAYQSSLTPLINTRLIIAQQTIDNQNGLFAALLAANFQVLEDGITPCKTPIAPESVCYGGWYLPSAYELQLLHNNLHQASLSSFAPEFYWSSTEASVSNAWLQNFATGEITPSSKSTTFGRVRAIRHF